MATTVQTPAFERHIDAYLQAKTQLEHAKAAHELARDQLLAYFPQAPGETEVLVGTRRSVTYQAGERMKWDQDELAKLAGKVSAITASTHYALHKRAYDQLSAEERALVDEALTIEPSAPRLTVTPIT